MTSRLLPALALAALFAAPAAAQPNVDRATAVAADGTVYAARVGTYRALFPTGTAAPANAPVLALDVTRADGTFTRQLVPGTDGAQTEGTPVVFLQEPSADVYLLWASNSSAGASLILRSYRAGTFSDSIALDDDPQAAKGVPQVALTRDAYTAVDTRGNERTVQRSVLHLVWWQGAGRHPEDIFYRSVLFVDGSLIGAQAPVALGNLDLDPAEPTAPQVAEGLVQAPLLDGGRNDHAALAAFANRRSGRLYSIELTVVPGELSSLADDTRDFTVGSGAVSASGDVQHIADLVRAHIIGVGRRMPAGVLVALGEAVRAHIIGVGRNFAGDPVALADDARRYLLREGANLLENGVDSPSILLNLSAILELPADSTGSSHQIQLRITGQRKSPLTPEAPHRIYASPDGTRVLVSWNDSKQVRYTQANDTGWTAPIGLSLSTLSQQAAESALERRVREP